MVPAALLNPISLRAQVRMVEPLERDQLLRRVVWDVLHAPEERARLPALQRRGYRVPRPRIRAGAGCRRVRRIPGGRR